MHDFLMSKEFELWDIFLYGPKVPLARNKKGEETSPRASQQYIDEDVKAIKKNAKDKMIILYGIGPNEYNRISTCINAKQIWDALENAHACSDQVKQSNIDMVSM